MCGYQHPARGGVLIITSCARAIGRDKPRGWLGLGFVQTSAVDTARGETDEGRAGVKGS